MIVHCAIISICLRLFKTVLSGFTPVRQLFIGDVGGDVTRAHCHAVPWRVSLSKHAVVEEEGEGPKRPRRLRVREGAYIGPDVLC